MSARHGDEGEGREGAAGREAGAESSLFTVPPPSVDVLEDRDVDDEEMESEDTREDFLSGTLGLGLPFPLAGGMAFKNTGTGVSAVGVLDWLEYPLDGEVTRWAFSGDVVFGLTEPPGRWGAAALHPSGACWPGPLPVGAPLPAARPPPGLAGSSCRPV